MFALVGLVLAFPYGDGDYNVSLIGISSDGMSVVVRTEATSDDLPGGVTDLEVCMLSTKSTQPSKCWKIVEYGMVVSADGDHSTDHRLRGKRWLEVKKALLAHGVHVVSDAASWKKGLKENPAAWMAPDESQWLELRRRSKGTSRDLVVDLVLRRGKSSLVLIPAIVSRSTQTVGYYPLDTVIQVNANTLLIVHPDLEKPYYKFVAF
ncbi:MAG: hypothetical protein AAFQ82_12640 [Myxococcota bacterium]